VLGGLFNQATLSPPRFPNGAAIQIKVIQVTGSEAIMQTSDQTQWRMAEVGATGLKFPPADTGGAPATYWKERLAPNNAP
jgi:hypothetical protein